MKYLSLMGIISSGINLLSLKSWERERLFSGFFCDL